MVSITATLPMMIPYLILAKKRCYTVYMQGVVEYRFVFKNIPQKADKFHKKLISSTNFIVAYSQRLHLYTMPSFYPERKYLQNFL